ncbi:MAG: response regulator [Bacteroidales bacterium]|nr:response regulator [Bacteroidales bacterium]
MSPSKYVKVLVIVGYGLMALLSIFGIVWVYMEWMKYSDLTEPYEKRTELVEISNTFAAMYQAESMGGLAAIVTDDVLRAEYDSLMSAVFVQIDFLKEKEEEWDMNEQLDSLAMLLLTKRENTLELARLIRSYDKDYVYSSTKRTVISRKDIKDLDNLLVNSVQQVEDTTTIVGEKKGLLRRIGDAIKKSQPDTLMHINTHTTSTIQEKVVPELKDTLVQFIEDINRVALRKNAAITVQLLRKQNELYGINEQTTAQINNILKVLNDKEEYLSNKLLTDRNSTIKRSTRIVSVIAIAAIFFSLLFMTRIIHSITLSQELQRKIEDSKKDIEKLLISREQLMLTISHDIKAPINSIMGYLELMKDKSSVNNIGYIQNMQQSARHILDLIQKLLDYHSLDANKQKIDSLRFSPYFLLTDIFESFIPKADEKHIQYQLDMDINTDVSCVSDPFRIRQIVDNFLSNALKFTPSYGSVTMAAFFREKKNKAELIISIKDTGPGIKEEDKDSIFEGFNRLDYTGINIEGSGLGLSITRKLTHLLEGEIKIESTLGEGSTFTVTLPVTKVREETPSNNENKEVKLSSVKVLFIDDDPIQLNLFSEFLKRKDMIPYTASTYNEASSLLQKEQFDVVFCDIQMADIDGFTMVKYIRMDKFENAETIPVIALTGKTEIPISEYISAGFSDYLPKPFTSVQLFKVINKFTLKEKMQMDNLLLQ